MSAPDVSVVVPTLGRRERYLRQALTSALRQDGVDVEVIVVADGAPERCAGVVAELDDGRATLMAHDAPRGVSEARNAGIGAARAPYVAFLDDDDLLAPDSAAARLAALDGAPGAVWSCSGSVHVDGALRIRGSSSPPVASSVPADLERWNVIPAPSCVMARRSDLLDAGLFDSRFSCHADWDLWLRLARRGPLVTVDRPLTAYRFHTDNMSADTELWDVERDRLREKHGVAPARARDHADARSRDRAEAWNYLRAGQSHRAVEQLSDLARRGDWKAGVLAGAMAVAPRVARRGDAVRVRRQVPQAWRREAEAWLGTLA